MSNCPLTTSQATTQPLMTRIAVRAGVHWHGDDLLLSHK